MAVGDRLAREVMEQSTVGAQKILDYNSEHFGNNSRHGKKRQKFKFPEQRFGAKKEIITIW